MSRSIPAGFASFDRAGLSLAQLSGALLGLPGPGEAARAAGVLPACGAARRYRLEVLFGRRWDSSGAGPCRLDLARSAAVLFPGRRFRVVPAG